MALVDEYENAVRTGNTQYANYLAQILASNAGININSNDVSAAPASLLPKAPSAPNAPIAPGGGILNGIFNWIDSIDPTAPKQGQTNASPLSGIGRKIGDAVVSAIPGGQTASSAIKFITDIPRVATTLLGLILIIAGIFALASGSAAKVIVNTVKSNVTS